MSDKIEELSRKFEKYNNRAEKIFWPALIWFVMCSISLLIFKTPWSILVGIVPVFFAMFLKARADSLWWDLYIARNKQSNESLQNKLSL